MIKGKKFLLLITSAVMLSMIASCGGTTSSSAASSAPASSSEPASSVTVSSEPAPASSNEPAPSSSESAPASSSALAAMTYKEAADSAVANADKVSLQTATYVDMWGDDMTKTFAYGEDANGAMGILTTSQEIGTEIELYKYLSNGKFVALTSYDEGESWGHDIPDEKYLGGMEFDFDQAYFGAEELIYAVANDKSCEELPSQNDGEYNIFAEAEYDEGGWMTYLMTANIQFSLDNYTGALDTATITITEYYNYTKNDDGTYNIEEDGTTTEYSLTNEFGTKLSEDPYNVEQFYSTDWKLYDGDNEISENYAVTTSAGLDDPLVFKFADILPETANLDIDYPDFKVYQGEEECESYWGNYWEGTEELTVTYLEPGNYTIVAETAKKSLSFALIITQCEPTAYNFTNYTEDLGSITERESSFEDEDGEFEGTTYVDTPIYLSAYTTPMAAGGTVEASCTSDKVTIESATIDTPWNGEVEAYEITASEAGTYDINLVNSDFPDGVTATYKLTVTEAPTLAEVLAKDYVASSTSGLAFEVSFEPGEENPAEGKVTIIDSSTDYDWDDNDDMYYIKHTNTYTYSYDEETKYFDLTIEEDSADADNEDWETPVLGLSSRMMPMVASSDWNTIYECSEDTPEARLVNATYTYGNADYGADDVTNLVTYQIDFDEDGTASLTFKDYRHAEWCFDDEEDEYYWEGVDRYYYVTTDDGFSLTETEDGYVISADWVEDWISPDEEDALDQEEIFQTLTLSKDLQTLVIKTASSSYTLYLA